MYAGKKVGIVIPAAGSGIRLGGGIAKQFLDVLGKPILARTLEQFEQHPAIDCIAIAGSPDGVDTIRDIVQSLGCKKVQWIGLGGTYRQDSVWNALQELQLSSVELVLIHDAVRPFVTTEIIDRVLHASVTTGAALAGVRTKDTIKVTDEHNIVTSTPRRESLWQAQTPQGFRMDLLIHAFRSAQEANVIGTDDASLVERLGVPVTMVEGSYENIKITTQEDLASANLIASKK